MSDQIVYIDRSTIRAGKLAEVKVAANELVTFVENHEPRLLSYGFFIDDEASRMTVVAVHPDSSAMEYHMDVAGPAFRPFADLIDLFAIEVYGWPGLRVVDQLHEKAASLGTNASVAIHEPHARFEQPAGSRQSGAPPG